MATPAEEIPNPFEDDNGMSEPPQDNSNNSGALSSADASRPSSRGRERPREKKRVGFTGGAESRDPSLNRKSWTSPNVTLSPSRSPVVSEKNTPSHSRQSSRDRLLSPLPSPRIPDLSPQQTAEIHRAFSPTLPLPKPRPAIRRTPSNQGPQLDAQLDGTEFPDTEAAYRSRRAQEAFERAKQLELDEKIGIPLVNLGRKALDGHNDKDDDGRVRKASTAEAEKLVRKHTMANAIFRDEPGTGNRSGLATPTEESGYFEDYAPRPDQYRSGILGALLKLYNHSGDSGAGNGSHSRSSSLPRAHFRQTSGDMTFSASHTPQHSPPDSGASTPIGGWSSGASTPVGGRSKSWYSPKHNNRSSSSLAQLVGTSTSLGSLAASSGFTEEVSQRLRDHRRTIEKRSGLRSRVSSTLGFTKPPEHKITVHIAETIARQRYLMKLCTALMHYGAPTHRLEEYMRMSARILEIDAQFLYLPGHTMIMSFDDASTHTTEVKMVKASNGLDLGKLRDVHEVYKDVVHDRTGVEQATARIKEVTSRTNKHSKWVLIFTWGLASACVGPFAFGARFIDLPIAFLLGCVLGTLKETLVHRSEIYQNVFEVGAAILMSFLARAFGSINHGNTFCFSALAQSSIALILPGYAVLCAALELQSRQMVAGSVRMVYAIIYSLFLGYGILIGTTIFGAFYHKATSATTCQNPMSSYWYILFVPGFTMCLIVINHAKWKQAPVMMVIACVGYLANFYTNRNHHFLGTQLPQTFGALTIGVLANLYSRLGGRVENYCLDLWEDRIRPRWRDFRKRLARRLHGGPSSTSPTKLESGLEDGPLAPEGRAIRGVGYSLAAAAMLPAILVQVPSGLGISGSLVAGIASANQIVGVGGGTNGSTVANATTLTAADGGLNSVAFTVGFSVIQVAIGITVGLFMSALVVYPNGRVKSRSGLFSF